MTPDRLERVADLFLAAKERPPGERAAFLEQACGDDRDVRAEVETLLESDSEAAAFLERPAAGSGFHVGATNGGSEIEPDSSSVRSPRSLADQRADANAGYGDAKGTLANAIPGYQILRELHRGGQGVVYQAVQNSTRRKVALKVMLQGPFAGLDSRRRFEREIELVGSLRHPGIVPIFDSGVGRGQFFYAMEYIRGEPLVDYVHNRRLAVDDILRLFQRVCDAIDYAHQRGVIHRDLKPQNILIDERGDPHVLDFGLAKIAGAEAAGESATRLVSVTGQVMGTLTYMSPEQAAGRPDQIDMRSDVYALGVILFESLTGQFPYDVSGPIATVLTAIQTIDPKRPSSVRGVRPEWKRQKHANDEIDTIILKALAKDKERRYNTAGSLGQDIGRFLAGEPIDAKHDSMIYLLSKVLRRYKGRAVVAASFVLLLGLFGVTMSMLYRQARDAERESNRTAERLRHNLYSYHLSRAALAFENHDLAAMRGFLAECPEELRHWEWGRLNQLSDLSETTLAGHEDRINAVRFSPDARRIASVSRDGTLRVWDAVTSQPLFIARGHKGEVNGLVYRYDGRVIASCGEDGTVRLWDAETGRSIREPILAHSHGVKAVAFSHNGTLIASGSRDRTVKLWNASTAERVRTLVGHEETVDGLAFSSDDGVIASSSHDGTLRLWNMLTGDIVWVSEPAPNRLRTVAFNSNETRLAAGCDSGEALVWDTATGKRILSMRGHRGPVTSVAYAPRGDSILSTSLDSGIKLWHAETGDEQTTIAGHERGSMWASFSPIGDRIVSAAGRLLRVWKLSDLDGTLTLRGHTDDVRHVAFRPDGHQVASAGFDHTIKLWNPDTGQEVRSLYGHTDRVTVVAYSPNGESIVSASNDRTLRLWNTNTGASVREFVGHSHPVWAAAVSSNGERIASGSSNGALRIWDVHTGRERRVVQAHQQAIEAVTFAPDEKRLVTCSRDTTLKLWNPETGELVGTLRGHPFEVLTAAFSPNGKQIISGSVDHALKLWDADTGQELATLHGHDGQVRCVAFSHDGKRVFSASLDRTLRVWDPTTRELLLTIRGHEDTVYDLSLSPDGSTIASASADGTVKLWTGTLGAAERRD